MFLIFGLVLMWTAVRLLTHPDASADVAGSGLVRAARRLLPVNDAYEGGRLLTRAGGRRVATPLLVHEEWHAGPEMP